MNFNEELLTNNRFVHLSKQRQTELITEHCARIKEKIRLATSLQEAERLVATACKKFESECSSSLVRNALFLYLHNLVEQYRKK